jgi:hypothetical protein
VRLVDLDPRFVDGPLLSAEDSRWDVLCTHVLCFGEGRKGVAVTFLCPHCVAAKLASTRLAFTLWNPTDGLGILYLVNGEWTKLKDVEHGDDARNFLWPASWTQSGSGNGWGDFSLAPNDPREVLATWVRYGSEHWHGRVVRGEVLDG